MEKRGISQEALKLIACITMLIDHVGATLVYRMCLTSYDMAWVHVYNLMRLIGRVAFPIYCFLLVEGAHYTRSPKKYAARLAIGAVLAEIPFDLAFSGRIDWYSSSVMVTLLLGFLMIEGMKRVQGVWQLLLILPFYGMAELLGTDYGGHGILIIAVLTLTRGMKYEKLLRLAAFPVLLWFGATITYGRITVPMELFGLAGLPLMFCYQGKKLTHSKTAQWAFYLFYPVHIALLVILEVLIFG